MAARSEIRALAAIERLHGNQPELQRGSVKWLELDLSDPRKVQDSAKRLLELETRLDILSEGNPIHLLCDVTG